jgi:hypothetical protein
MAEAKEAERVAKAQWIAAGRWLRVDESKVTSPKDTMLLHRVRAAAADRVHRRRLKAEFGSTSTLKAQSK